VEGSEAEALLFLAAYHKEHGAYVTASIFASRLFEYPGPEKEQAKALTREIKARSRVTKIPHGPVSLTIMSSSSTATSAGTRPQTRSQTQRVDQSENNEGMIETSTIERVEDNNQSVQHTREETFEFSP
jgi:hypothetical protein